MVGNLLRNAHNISIYFRTFAPMNERQKETLRVRIISVGITCLAFVVFKPIGFVVEGNPPGYLAFGFLLIRRRTLLALQVSQPLPCARTGRDKADE